MKNIVENLVVTMVVLLFLGVIALVVKYNMIGIDSTDTPAVPEQISEQDIHKKETKDYLKSLESYGEDEDVKVDPKQESHKNTVKVISEVTSDELGRALRSDEKRSYLKSLERYSDNKKAVSKTEKLEDVKPEKVQNDDTISSELDSILGE